MLAVEYRKELPIAEVNECESSPCLHEGTCENNINMLLC